MIVPPPEDGTAISNAGLASRLVFVTMGVHVPPKSALFHNAPRFPRSVPAYTVPGWLVSSARTLIVPPAGPVRCHDPVGGTREIVRKTDADLVGSAWLVAVTVTFCGMGTRPGAV